eukprot:6679162-Alexandrium_andersonii.AAC.1
MLARGGQRTAAAHPTTASVSPTLRAVAQRPQPTPASQPKAASAARTKTTSPTKSNGIRGEA